MANLKIDCDAGSVEAILSTQKDSRGWEIILRTVREYVDDVKVLSPYEVRFPWWAFLATRTHIAYQIYANQISVEFSSRAKQLLEAAKVRTDLLTNASEEPSVGLEIVLEKIKTWGFDRDLKWFQNRNVQRLCRLPVGASFSVPGSGKTTEALAFFYFWRNSHSKLLVVAPKNAFAAWEYELAKCFSQVNRRSRFVRLVGGAYRISRLLRSESPDLMLLTYEQLPNVVSLITGYLAKHDSFIFLDESHRIKGGVGKVRASSVLKISQAAGRRLVLSGTPLPNSTTDIIPQFQFLAPELPDTADPVDLIRPFFVRTTKSDLGLEPVNRILVQVDLGETQRRLYNLLRSEAAREAASILNRGQRRAFRQIGRSAMRLLQFVSNPSLLVGKVPEFDELLGDVIEERDSPKIEWTCQRARSLARQGEKVVIWSSFVENVETISERLADLGSDYIHGGVDASSEFEEDSREYKIRRFHDDKYAMVLVANPAACSEGISLHTVCNHAIYVDRNYNLAQFLQSEDRIHRIGSAAQKHSEIVVSHDTVDMSVNARLLDKETRMRAALNDPEIKIDPVPFDADETNLDTEDVLDLLKHLKNRAEAFA